MIRPGEGPQNLDSRHHCGYYNKNVNKATAPHPEAAVNTTGLATGRDGENRLS